MDELRACNYDQCALTHLHGEYRTVFGAKITNNVHEGTPLEDDLDQISY